MGRAGTDRIVRFFLSAGAGADPVRRACALPARPKQHNHRDDNDLQQKSGPKKPSKSSRYPTESHRNPEQTTLEVAPNPSQAGLTFPKVGAHPARTIAPMARHPDPPVYLKEPPGDADPAGLLETEW